MNLMSKFQSAVASLEDFAVQVPVDGVEPIVAPDDELSAEDITIDDDGDVEIASGTPAEIAEIHEIASDEDVEVDQDAEAEQLVVASTIVSNDATREDLLQTQSQLQATVESLKNIEQFARKFPVVNATTAKLLNKATRVHARRLGLESADIAADISGDQVNLNPEVPAAMAEAAGEALPHISEQITAVDNRAKDLAEEAQEIPQEVMVEARSQADVVATEEEVEQLAGESGAAESDLGEVVEIAEQENAEGGMTLESLLALNITMEAYSAPLGLASMDVVPGIESFNADERYQVSLEAIYGKRAEIDNVAKDVLKRYVQTLFRINMPVFRIAMVQRARLAMLAKRVRGMPSRVSENVGVKVNARNLHQNGQIPSNPAQFLGQYAEQAAFMVGKFHERAKNSFAINVNLIQSAGGNDNEETARVLASIAKAWSDPRDGLPRHLIDFDAPGGRRIFADVGDSNYNGNVQGFSRIADFSTKNIPTRVLFRKNDSRPPVGNWPVLNGQDLPKVVAAFQRAYQSADHLQHFVEKVAAGNWAPIVIYIKVLRRLAGPRIFFGAGATEFATEFSLLNRAIRTSNRMCFHVGIDSMFTLNHITNSFIGYANRSLKAARAYGSMESVALGGEFSLESAGKIGRGSNVMYGKKAGKVVKVHTSDFEFGDKTVKASKTAPMYEVKQHKTGKLSVHKASALTLA